MSLIDQCKPSEDAPWGKCPRSMTDRSPRKGQPCYKKLYEGQIICKECEKSNVGKAWLLQQQGAPGETQSSKPESPPGPRPPPPPPRKTSPLPIPAKSKPPPPEPEIPDDVSICSCASGLTEEQDIDLKSFPLPIRDEGNDPAPYQPKSYMDPTGLDESEIARRVNDHYNNYPALNERIPPESISHLPPEEQMSLVRHQLKVLGMQRIVDAGIQHCASTVEYISASKGNPLPGFSEEFMSNPMTSEASYEITLDLISEGYEEPPAWVKLALVAWGCYSGAKNRAQQLNDVRAAGAPTYKE